MLSIRNAVQRSDESASTWKFSLCNAYFRYRGSIEYRDTWDGIVIVELILGIAQHYPKLIQILTLFSSLEGGLLLSARQKISNVSGFTWRDVIVGGVSSSGYHVLTRTSLVFTC